MTRHVDMAAKMFLVRIKRSDVSTFCGRHQVRQHGTTTGVEVRTDRTPVEFLDALFGGNWFKHGALCNGRHFTSPWRYGKFTIRQPQNPPESCRLFAAGSCGTVSIDRVAKVRQYPRAFTGRGTNEQKSMGSSP